MKGKDDPGPARRWYLPILIMAFCLFAWASLLTFNVADAPSPMQFPPADPPENMCGPVGAWFSYHLLYYFGEGIYLFVLMLTLAAGTWLIRGQVHGIWQRAFGIAMLVSCTSAMIHLICPDGVNALTTGRGGVLGASFGNVLQKNFSGVGTALILAYCLVVGLLFSAEDWVLAVARRAPGLLARMGHRLAHHAATGAAIARTSATLARSHSAVTATVATPRPRTKRNEPRINPGRAPTRKERNEEEDATLFDVAGARKSKPQPPDDNEPAGVVDVDDAGAGDEAVAVDLTKPLPVVCTPKQEKAGQPEAAYPHQLDEWTYPPPSLLNDPEYVLTSHQEAFVRDKAKILERTLEEFRIDACVVEIDTGPVITMYELQLAPGIKVSQISVLSNDIARALKAQAIRVVAPIPGKNTVGIEVPNLDKEKVRLKELITLAGKRAQKMALPLFLGKDASGNALIGDLAAMPHLLIAGTTGSGKSVCINTIICSLLMLRRPDRVKLIVIDPKMVELSAFKEIPHLMSPIVTDMQRAEQVLEWATTKMDERYALLAEAGVKHIKAYNELTEADLLDRFDPTSDEELARIPLNLPYIVIVIDELADLMMTCAKEVEHHLSRLAQKSRAVGVHIVVATQRPEVKVVTGLIKSNLPCRISFRVSSRMDSRIVLDQNGAELLMGQGDMLFLPPGSAKLIRSQGTFIDDHEVEKLVAFLRDQAEPEFHPELIGIPSHKSGAMPQDELFDDAVQVVLETQRGSVSLLQRRLGVGYSRAARLIEMMADAGVVGAYKGSQAREVTITPEEWQALKNQTQPDAEDDEDWDDEPVPDLIDAQDIYD